MNKFKLLVCFVMSLLIISLSFPSIQVVAGDGDNGNGNSNGNSGGNGNGNGQYNGPSLLKNFNRDVMKNPITNEEKQKAAFAAKLLREQTKELKKEKGGGVVAPSLTPVPGGVPDIFGPYGNYAYSQQPQIDANGNVIAGTGIRKFVDGLPGLGPAGANNLGQYIPVAVPDTKTYPGTDYYEIAAVQYTEKMHSDLPATPNLRGYVQLNYGTDGTGNNTIAPAPVHYLGPAIQGSQGRPVRLKFTNLVKTTTDPLHLFLPVDVTMMGAGTGPDGKTLMPDSRVTMPHLHGGDTEWNSDGTPDTWLSPILQTGTPTGAGWTKAFSTTDVSDMPVSPGGSVTLYWTNGISARLMMFHDHTQGYTAQTAYDGLAAPFILRDATEATLISGGTIPGTTTTVPAGTIPDSAHEIPLVIQDKTFVPTTTGTFTNMNGTFTGGEIGAEDPTWDTTKWGGQGALWYPHVYMSMENPYNTPNGVTPMGRWDYGPWVGAPVIWLNGPIANPYYDPVNAPWEPPLTIGTPNVSVTGEAFADTMVVNGTAYPTMTVQPQAYRFRILSIGTDRALNLSLFLAAPLTGSVTKMGSGYTSPPSVAINGGSVSGATASATLGVASITVNNIGAGYDATNPPKVTITGGSGTGAQAGAVITAAGTISSFVILTPGSGFVSVPTVTIDPPILTGGVQATATAVMGLGSVSFSGGTASSGSIVNPTLSFSGGGGTGAAAIASVLSDPKMVPASVDPSIPFPTSWTTATGAGVRPNILDGRLGGVPDPRTMGPSWLAIGNEGGFMPMAQTIDPSPTGYDHNSGDMIYDNVINHSLQLMPAERADAIVDFSKFAGQTLILFNDAPAPFPRWYFPNDMYTNDLDMTLGGGPPSTLAGYGCNTRTVMQIRVAPASPVPFNAAPITSALPVVFKATQPPPIVPSPIFNAAYGANYPTDFVRPLDVMFSPAVGGTTVNNVVVTGRGTLYYTGVPSVILTGGGPGGGKPTTIATATAALLDQGGIDAIVPAYEGSGYVTAPTVTISAPPAGGTQAVAQAFVSAGQVFRIDVINSGSGYIQIPTVTVSAPPAGGAQCYASATLGTDFQIVGPGTGYNAATTTATISAPPAGGTPATATPYLGIASVTLSTVGNYPSQDVNHPVVITVTGGGGTGAVLTPVMAANPIPGSLQMGYTVASVAILNPGSGYTSLPTITFSGGGAGSTQATAVVASLGVTRLYATNAGAGYTTAPTVTITDTAVAPLVPGTGASITVVPLIGGKLTTGRLGNITITNGGSGYTTAPQVTFFGGGTGSTAMAYATLAGTTNYWIVPHTLTGTFERYYGRLTQYFGTNLALSNFYVDPPYDYYGDSVTIGPPVAGDSTQIWRIAEAPGTVDTHVIHFHLINVQVVCRITADGNIFGPEPQELGFKESVAIHPNEDLVVAMRPVGPKLPFGVPDNIRPLSPSEPIGATGSFSGLTSAGAGISISNQLFNFHWEYVYHCHMLSHEDNDLMRPVVFLPAVALPATPTGVAVSTTGGNTVTWTDPTPITSATTLGNPANEVGFQIWRAPGTSGGTFTQIGTVPANTTRFVDGTATTGSTYRYYVKSFNAAGTSAASTTITRTSSVAPALPTVPALSSPAAGASVTTSAPIQFAWGAVTGATSYTLQVLSGTTVVVNMPGLIAPNITIPNQLLTPGAYTWRASATNNRGTSALSAARALTLATAAPTKIVFTTSAQTITSATASGIITIQTQDATSAPANVTGATTVSLTSSSITGRFDTSAAGAFNGTITSVSIPAGANTASFYYKDTTVGTPMITAAATSLTSGTQTEIVAAPPVVPQQTRVNITAPNTVIPNTAVNIVASLAQLPSATKITSAGNPLTFNYVIFNLETATNTSGSATVNTNASGDAALTLTAPNAKSVILVDVVFGGSATNLAASNMKIISALPLIGTTITATNTLGNINFHLADQFGNALATQTLTFTTTSGLLSGTSAVTNATGDASVSVNGTNNATVSASFGGFINASGWAYQPTLARINVDTVASANSPTRVVTVAPGIVNPNDTVNVVASVYQLPGITKVAVAGNPITFNYVIFNLETATNTSGTSTVNTNAAGDAALTLTAPNAKSVILVDAVFGGSGTLLASSNMVIVPCVPVIGTTITASASGGMVSFHLADQFGNALANQTLSFLTTAGTLSAASGASNATGDVTVTVSGATSAVVSASFGGFINASGWAYQPTLVRIGF